MSWKYLNYDGLWESKKFSDELWQVMVNKGSHFADFVRFRPHTYTRTQQYLPSLWAAINCGVFFCFCYANYYFFKKISTLRTNIFIFPTDRAFSFFAVSHVDQKINLVLPNPKCIWIDLFTALTTLLEAEYRDRIWLLAKKEVSDIKVFLFLRISS